MRKRAALRPGLFFCSAVVCTVVIDLGLSTALYVALVVEYSMRTYCTYSTVRKFVNLDLLQSNFDLQYSTYCILGVYISNM